MIYTQGCSGLHCLSIKVGKTYTFISSELFKLCSNPKNAMLYVAIKNNDVDLCFWQDILSEEKCYQRYLWHDSILFLRYMHEKKVWKRFSKILTVFIFEYWDYQWFLLPSWSLFKLNHCIKCVCFRVGSLYNQEREWWNYFHFWIKLKCVFGEMARESTRWVNPVWNRDK